MPERDVDGDVEAVSDLAVHLNHHRDHVDGGQVGVELRQAGRGLGLFRFGRGDWRKAPRRSINGHTIPTWNRRIGFHPFD